MILNYRGIKIELSRLDYEIWREHLNPARIKKRFAVLGGRRGKQFVLPGRCPFCERFELIRRGYEHNCTECPLIPWGVHDGNDKIDGCVNLMVDVLGESEPRGSLVQWGLIFGKDFTVVVGDKGKKSIVKMRKAIEQSVVDHSDREGVISYLEDYKKEKEEKKWCDSENEKEETGEKENGTEKICEA